MGQYVLRDFDGTEDIGGYGDFGIGDVLVGNIVVRVGAWNLGFGAGIGMIVSGVGFWVMLDNLGSTTDIVGAGEINVVEGCGMSGGTGVGVLRRGSG